MVIANSSIEMDTTEQYRMVTPRVIRVMFRICFAKLNACVTLVGLGSTVQYQLTIFNKRFFRGRLCVRIC